MAKTLHEIIGLPLKKLEEVSSVMGAAMETKQMPTKVVEQVFNKALASSDNRVAFAYGVMVGRFMAQPEGPLQKAPDDKMFR